MPPLPIDPGAALVDPLGLLRRLVLSARGNPAPAVPDSTVATPHGSTTVVAPAGAGERLGGVKLGPVIGAGGMGTVHRGRHEILDIDVAVKVMKAVADPERFLKEARLAARVQHAHIARVLHAGSERGLFFLVMELIDGANLKQLLARHGAVPWAVAAALAAQAARGLGAAHRAGIVHRDVKPSNLIVTVDGELKVADLGLAREARGDDDHTETGIIVGTPAYMAPEQARESSSAGPRADVYALGATLFHLLAGEPPFKRSSQTSVLLAHLNQPAPDARLFVKDLPPAVADLVGRMLAKDPIRRPADGDAVAAELEALCGGSSPATRPLVARATAPARASALLAAAVALIALGAFAWRVTAGAPARAVTATLHPTAALAPAAADAAPRGDATPAAGGPGAVTTAATAGAEPHAAGAVPADAWRTPERACFALDAGLPEDQRVALHAALLASGVRVVERERLASLVAELDLADRGREDAGSAVRVGRLVGGQVALVATPSGARVHLRAVPIETGEIAGDRMVEAEGLADAASALVRAALAALPAQGRVTRDGQTSWLDLGSRHGVARGDRFELLDGAGRRVGTATVAAVEPGRAALAVDGDGPSAGMARRLDAP